MFASWDIFYIFIWFSLYINVITSKRELSFSLNGLKIITDPYRRIVLFLVKVLVSSLTRFYILFHRNLIKMSTKIVPVAERCIPDNESNDSFSSTEESNSSTYLNDCMLTENRSMPSDSETSTSAASCADFDAETKEAVTAILYFLHELLQFNPKSSTQQKIENKPSTTNTLPVNSSLWNLSKTDMRNISNEFTLSITHASSHRSAVKNITEKFVALSKMCERYPSFLSAIEGITNLVRKKTNSSAPAALYSSAFISFLDVYTDITVAVRYCIIELERFQSFTHYSP